VLLKLANVLVAAATVDGTARALSTVDSPTQSPASMPANAGRSD